MFKKYKKYIITAIASAVGSLATWCLINWIPSVTILVGAVLCGYIAYTNIK